MSWRSSFQNFDKTLALFALLLCGAGVALVFSATFHQAALQHLAWRQLSWALLGCLAASLTMSLDYQSLASRSKFMYGGLVLVLLVLLFLGRQSSHGATSWVDFRFFYFQPSELAKLVLILVLTRHLVAHEHELGHFSGLIVPLGISGFLMVLILRQPDLGTALVMIPMTLAMLFVAGARKRHLALISLGLGAAVPLIWSLLKDYQKRRILTFWDPQLDSLGSGYNAIQSQIAVGSGGWLGKGYLQGTQSQLHFVPFHHTDFIFSVVAEEWGFAGAAALILVYVGLLARLAEIGSKSRSLAGSLLCAGLLSMLATQMMVNIGMSMGLLPVTGLPLPMVSYGGSSTVTAMAGLGMALSIRKEGLGA